MTATISGMSGLSSRWAGTVRLAVPLCRLLPMASEQTAAERLQELEYRLHILDGLLRVLDDPHRFTDVVLSGTEIDDTVEALQEAFGFSHIQAVAALDMQFRRLSKRTQSSMRSDVEQMRLERTRLSPS
ncbi:hypothetical protein [Nocardioides psychrotolerans]|uniref:hypothetical protein n=1 Tax=Nocardioides psychrotolerans TaxID=1005945 RepID=UPI0031383E07